MFIDAATRIQEMAGAAVKIKVGGTKKLAELGLKIRMQFQQLVERDGGKLRVLAFYDIKGGVGKTTATVHIGIRLAELGFKVCVIDFDNNPRLTNFILSAAYSNAKDATSCKEIVHQMKHYDYITADSVLGGWAEEQELELRSETLGGRFAQDQFFIVPGTHDSNIDEDTGGEYTEYEMTRNIRNSINYIAKTVDLDFILIDNAASANTRVRSTMWSITDLMIPTDGKEMSTDTVGELSNVIALGINQARNKYGIPPFKTLGVFLNNMATLKSDEAYAANKIRESLQAKDLGFSNNIMNRKVYKEAYKKGFFAWELKSTKNRKGNFPSVEAHEEVTGLVSEMLGKMIIKNSKPYEDHEVTPEIYETYRSLVTEKRSKDVAAINKKLGLDSEEYSGDEEEIARTEFEGVSHDR